MFVILHHLKGKYNKYGTALRYDNVLGVCIQTALKDSFFSPYAFYAMLY